MDIFLGWMDISLDCNLWENAFKEGSRVQPIIVRTTSLNEPKL